MVQSTPYAAPLLKLPPRYSQAENVRILKYIEKHPEVYHMAQHLLGWDDNAATDMILKLASEE